MISLTWETKTVKFFFFFSQILRDTKQDGGCQGLAGGGLFLNGDRAPVWEDGKVQEMDGGDSSQQCEYTLLSLNHTLKNGYKFTLCMFH